MAAPKSIEQQIDEQGVIPWGDNLTPAKRRRNRAPAKFDAKRKARFLEHYAKTGLFMQSAKACGVSYMTAKRHYDADKAFANLIDDAKDVFNESLEAEAVRRATKGVVEPVFGSTTKEVPKADGKGMKVVRTMGRIGGKRKYSDTLLQFVMKKHMPEYRENMTVNQNVRGMLVTGELPVNAFDEGQWADSAKGVRATAIDIDTPDNDNGHDVQRA